MIPQYVIVAGYVWSGSSAVVDLLKEYKGAWEANNEFRLIKDPYGLSDLRYHLIESWDPLNSDNAVKDFLWLVKHLNHTNSKLSLVSGLGYGSENSFGDKFMIETYKFIDRICDFRYSGSWWMSDFKKSKMQFLLKKIRGRLGLVKNESMYFVSCTEDEFDNAVQEYLNALFLHRSQIDKDGFAILDQALPAQNPGLLNNYFQNSKMIIVDRDPRDIYIETIQGGVLIGPELETNNDISLFVKWHKQYRKNIKNIKNTKNIMIINFEEIVTNYENSVKKIEEFIGINSKKHVLYRQKFNPDISKNNVGKWRNYQDKVAIKKIEEELSEYLWN